MGSIGFHTQTLIHWILKDGKLPKIEVISSLILSLLEANPYHHNLFNLYISYQAMSGAAEAGEDPTRTLVVGGDSLKLDELGPVVINADGTTGRISNWQSMLPAERESAIRLIAARNKRRIEVLKAEHAEREAGAGMDAIVEEEEPTEKFQIEN